MSMRHQVHLGSFAWVRSCVHASSECVHVSICTRAQIHAVTCDCAHVGDFANVRACTRNRCAYTCAPPCEGGASMRVYVGVSADPQQCPVIDEKTK